MGEAKGVMVVSVDTTLWDSVLMLTLVIQVILNNTNNLNTNLNTNNLNTNLNTTNNNTTPNLYTTTVTTVTPVILALRAIVVTVAFVKREFIIKVAPMYLILVA